ncbi:RNA polymerase II associated protein [Schizosaccharomyces cryophilus OY26]|uniref:RNA polymerase II associated protein n=1 Tax=Schizosaccharomyces cryophilus (strain OY26 / ATCC MYA-4695 / CBS 11777 / NBRC 106824 / NRRL Y48691) TaxID=653667 RepID=S9VNB8_SCHCR|nr:RNA polymerase II associated protein [Schizosaccharomyces cryophilus OY26]EPY49438.1 RNA polymerase II associated protein [Schizosaccharomyces cryophilus OY26]
MTERGGLFSNVIGDVVERPKTSGPNELKSKQRHPGGFPSIPKVLPKRHTNSMSTFKERQTRNKKASPKEEERGYSDAQGIDDENRVRLDRMDEMEILEAQSEVRSTIREDLLDMLLNRYKKKVEKEASLQSSSSNLTGQSTDTYVPSRFRSTNLDHSNSNLESVLSSDVVESSSSSNASPSNGEKVGKLKTGKNVTFGNAPIKRERNKSASLLEKQIQSNLEKKTNETNMKSGEEVGSSNAPLEPGLNVHLPEKRVELDPNDSDFYEQLHEKYFPNLPVDEKQMQWLKDPSEEENTYNPEAEGVHAHQIRFGFRGEIIPPGKSHKVPVTEGLHHHGDAPSSAGYTLVELAHLLRSQFPTQRCIAIQTVGRILYRLNSGEFGDIVSPELHTLVEDTNILDLLIAASGENVRHMTVRSLAIEALWLTSQSQHGSTRQAL